MENKQWLDNTLDEKMNPKLFVGQTVRVGDSESGEGREHYNKRRKGKIIGFYEHHMSVQFPGGKESFSYVDIVTSISNYADIKNRGGERFFSAKFGRESTNR